MAKVEGLNRLRTKLQALQKQKPPESVEVGFSQSYAIYVHENLEAYHRVGQAKFLEQPARTMQPELQRVLRSVFEKTGDLQKALLAAGLRLQAAAQKLTPVDTGALRASAYTALKSEAGAAASKARSNSLAEDAVSDAGNSGRPRDPVTGRFIKA